MPTQIAEKFGEVLQVPALPDAIVDEYTARLEHNRLEAIRIINNVRIGDRFRSLEHRYSASDEHVWEVARTPRRRQDGTVIEFKLVQVTNRRKSIRISPVKLREDYLPTAQP